MDVQRKRVTIMGLGHFGGGVAVTRWMARHGARVTVTDVADRQTLAGSLSALSGVSLEACHLGGHREEDFTRADLLVVNPAVRPDNPFLDLAREAGAEITTEIGVFLRICPAATIGVTGTNGKSTTAAMIAAVLEADYRRVWLGGNLGGSLLDHGEQIEPSHWVVLELSSFQLSYSGPGTPVPRVAVITNCAPNHLDWHRSYGEYIAAKQSLLRRQRADDLAVLNTDDTEVASWTHLIRGRPIALVDADEIPALAVPGRHNRSNARLAATVGRALEVDPEKVRGALAGLEGLPQRLELIGQWQGRRFIDDSAATTPESTMAALQADLGPLWLLAGGRTKGADLGPLAARIVRSACGAAFYGESAEDLAAQVLGRSPDFPATATRTLDEAVAWCWERSRPGQCLVLSPGCSSRDQFQNYRQRSEYYREQVEILIRDARRVNRDD
jgi:UDP-N-acetylmuramoylalanine--D-glutamate ligase